MAPSLASSSLAPSMASSSMAPTLAPSMAPSTMAPPTNLACRPRAGATDGPQSAAPLFEAATRPRQDACARAARTEDNATQAQYTLTGPVALQREACVRAGAGCQSPRDFALGHRNMRSWAAERGVAAAEAIDDESALLNDAEQTLTGHVRQLPKRVFQAVPDRSRGPPRPKAESAVQRGLATSRKLEDQVLALAEKTDFRFHPELDRLGIRGGVALPGDLARGGASSRDIVRSPEFLRSIGYTFDGRAWTRRGSR